MDSSRLTEIKRNQFINAFVKINPSMNHFKTELEVIYKNLGGRPVIFEGRLVGNQPYEVDSTAETQEEMVQDLIMDALGDLFTFMAASNSGPTICARSMYLFFFSITASYNGIVGGKSGSHDNWNWSKAYSLSSDTLYSWIQQTLAFCLPNIIPGWTNHITTFSSAFGVFSADWTTWYGIRSVDNGQVGGSARTAPTYLVLNHDTTTNAITYLETTTSQDFTDTTQYQDPAKWTPLSINNVKKNYLTYGWGTVISPSLQAADETSIKAVVAAYYPLNRSAEITSLLSLTESLTDTQKVIAEFWAGGPNTITPPGMCMWFWKEYILSQGMSDLNTLFFSGLDLSIGIFEASRLCWNIKGANLQARPIQEIRRTALGTTVTKYDGTTINRNVWVPFQPTSIVTPPFADFPSGHSTFSQIFADIMTEWFGATINVAPAPFFQTSLLSPIITTSQRGNNFGTFTISSGSSEIQAGVVPASPVTLTFATWQEIADQAGLSRQYGGIHAASAHSGGQALANAIRPIQKTNWLLR